jgi:hypothetical protein
MRRLPFTPRRFLVLISDRGSVKLRAIVRLEGLGQIKYPVISTGFEAEVSQLVAECLYHLRYSMPPILFYFK